MPNTSFSDTQNEVFVILASEFKGFIFVCAVFLFWRGFESGFFTVLQGQNHTGTPKTPFSDTKNGVFAILTSKLKGFISVFAVFSILERVCKVYHASENGFFTICKVGFVYSEEGL